MSSSKLYSAMLLCFCAMQTSGCILPFFLCRLQTEDVAIYDDRLLGSWTDSDSSHWTFIELGKQSSREYNTIQEGNRNKLGAAKSYRLEHTTRNSNGQIKKSFQYVELSKLGTEVFIDMQRDYKTFDSILNRCQDLFEYEQQEGILNIHTIYKIKFLSDKAFVVTNISFEHLSKQFNQHKVPFPLVELNTESYYHESRNTYPTNIDKDSIFLPTTWQLQDFLKNIGKNDNDYFPSEYSDTLYRIK